MAEISEQSPYSKLTNDIISIINEKMPQFQQIWEEIGYDESEIKLRCNMIAQHTQQLFEEMLEEASSTRAKFIEKVERLLAEACELGKEVGMPQVKDYDSNILMDAKRYLQQKVEEYREIKKERMDRLARYKTQELALCEALDIPRRPEFSNVPTNEQLDEYESYLAEKEEEKERLMCIYRETKVAIINLIRELGETPLLNFHKLVVYEDESKFNPSKKNMTMLKEYHQELETQLEDTKLTALELREKLSVLWERLQQDIHHRELFLAEHQGYSLSTIRALREEIQRCEEMKRQNIKKFVNEIRRELTDWWEKCLTSEEEKNKFTPYKSSIYTEDLLELHELEVKRLKRYYEENINIFQLAVERQKLWDKMLDLEGRANDPERLFKNRGGQLLREEQERKNIQKELPKVEKELLKYLNEYEMKHGSPFYIDGETFKDRMNRQWEHHKANKESEKSARKARDHLSKIESRAGTNMTAVKRKQPPSSSPLPSTSTKKRYVTASSGKVKRNPAWKKEEKKRTPKVRRKILERYLPTHSSPATSQELAEPLQDLNSTNTTTYTDFQNDLEERNQQETCRSSVAPSRYLKECNIYPLPKKAPLTPKRNLKSTPVKPPRKNIGSGQFSTPKTPLNGRVTPNRSTQLQGGAMTPRLTASRGRLPIII